MTMDRIHLPSAVRADVKHIASEIHNPRDFPDLSRDRFEMLVVCQLGALPAAPAMWKQAVRTGFEDVIGQHCPANRRDMIAGKIRQAKWQTCGPSEWERIKQAPGKFIKSFLAASSEQVKRATQVVKQLRQLDKLLATPPAEPARADERANPVLSTAAWASGKQTVKDVKTTNDVAGISFRASANGYQEITGGDSKTVAPSLSGSAQAAAVSVSAGNSRKELSPKADVTASAAGVNVAVANNKVTATASATGTLSAEGARVNMFNVKAKAALPEASASACARAVEVDVGNARLKTGVSAGAHAAATAASVRVGNANVDLSVGPKVGKSIEGFSVAIGNVDVAPMKFGVGASLGGFKIFNFSFGGTFNFDLNPLNLFNLGFGGGGGGGGSSGGEAGAGSVGGSADAGGAVAGAASDSRDIAGPGAAPDAGGAAPIHGSEGAVGGHTGAAEAHSYDVDGKLKAPKAGTAREGQPLSRSDDLIALVTSGKLALRIVVTSNGQRHDVLAVGGGREILLFDVEAAREAEVPARRVIDAKYLAGVLRILAGDDGASRTDALKVVRILFSPAQAGRYRAEDLAVEVTAGALDPEDGLVQKLVRNKIVRLSDGAAHAASMNEDTVAEDTREVVGMVNEVFEKMSKGHLFDSSLVRYVDQAVQSGDLGADEGVTRSGAAKRREVELCGFCRPTGRPGCMSCVLRATDDGHQEKFTKISGNMWGFS